MSDDEVASIAGAAGAVSDETPEPLISEPPIPEPLLPEPVRARVVDLVAAAVAELTPDEVPAALRKVVRFAPKARARLGGSLLAGHLTNDALFRARVGKRVLEAMGELGTAIAEGTPPGAADPVLVAALAYLARPEGWRELVEAAAHALRVDADSAAVTDRLASAEQLVARAEHERSIARTEADKLRDELTRLRAETAGLHEQVRQLTRSLRDSQARERKAADVLATERGRAVRAAAESDAEVRRLRGKLEELEESLAGARTVSHQARAADDARLWLLLETISGAAAGLRRELAMDPATKLPADFVADVAAERPVAASTRARGLEADDPARLDHLLALPRAHLIVDGYNVTKRGFPDMSLEHQRVRLTSALVGLAAQTGAEVTCVFDGSDRMVAVPGQPRGVRVLFSPKGVIADEVIRQLVRAEPAGRPLVVISSDKEVIDGVRRHGAYALSADTLIKRIARA